MKNSCKNAAVTGCLDWLDAFSNPAPWFVWDPTESVATRPLVFRYAPNSLNLFYAFDGNKNVSDVFYRMTANGIGAHYDYAPFGATTRTHSDSSASFDIVALNPFRFSSEHYDSELDLVYYNYRHYSPDLGRFLSRDPIEEQGFNLRFNEFSQKESCLYNLYVFVKNQIFSLSDAKGLDITLEEDNASIWPYQSGLHMQIRVERWDVSNERCNEENKTSCCLSGKECFSFGLNLSNPVVFRLYSKIWLGWPITVMGCVANGVVYMPDPVKDSDIIGRHKTTMIQDEKWFDYMTKSKRVLLEDAYSTVHNCRMFSQLEFRDAPLHW